VAIALAAAAAALSVVDYSIVEVARNLTQGATLVALGCALGAFHRREHDRATRTEQRYAEPI
jgi:seryl-tRNA(Sec) selenium transferase